MGWRKDLATVESPVPSDPVAAADEGPGTLARAQAQAGLYVHVPFCTTRCTYCDFATDTLTRARLESYMEAIELELRLRSRAAGRLELTSVFFGGGTPSVLPSRHIRRLFDVIRDTYRIAPSAEITLEANPESVRERLLDTWADLGVNRLSLGVQSFDDTELRTLGRIHDAVRPAEAVRHLRAHGFPHYSIDLMFGYPGHGPKQWARTMQRAIDLEPEHVSAYCFVAEPCTPLGHASLTGRRPAPSSDDQSDAYAALQAVMSRNGYGCYETSNFCRPDREARHNLVYWLRRPYVGVGPSAHGALNGVRYGNERSLDAWARGVMQSAADRDGAFAFEVREAETADARADEIVMLGLRLSSGLHESDYAPSVWTSVRERYAEAFARGVESGRLTRTGRGWRIPASLRFLADDVIAWLAARVARS